MKCLKEDSLYFSIFYGDGRCDISGDNISTHTWSDMRTPRYFVYRVMILTCAIFSSKWGTYNLPTWLLRDEIGIIIGYTSCTTAGCHLKIGCCQEMTQLHRQVSFAVNATRISWDSPDTDLHYWTASDVFFWEWFGRGPCLHNSYGEFMGLDMKPAESILMYRNDPWLCRPFSASSSPNDFTARSAFLAPLHGSSYSPTYTIVISYRFM